MEVKNCKTQVQDDQEETVISSVSKEAVVVVDDEVDDQEGPLPGFRFHPTDEELVSFYLKRKVEKRKPLKIEIIKQIDIYKHDPWDLAKASSSAGDKEWYFYCKRGRKYRNSIRPNRVTGSGFWKATGIDRPIYSNGGEGHQCIGLKKSLVYYRGSAGKGTKTDWMMHEFRLPSDINQHDHNFSNLKDTTQEAEIWTLCRIFKRNKKHTPDWRELSSRKNAVNASSKTSSIDSNTNNQEHYISFTNTHQGALNNGCNNNNHHYVNSDDSDDVYMQNHNNVITSDQKNVNLHATYLQQQQLQLQQQWNSMAHIPPYTNHVLTNDDNHLQNNLTYYGWDDLNSVVEFAFKQPFL